MKADVRCLSLMASLVMSLATCQFAAAGAADTGQSSIVFITPKRGDTVQKINHVAGRIELSGKPVLLVRNDVEGASWWVQEPIEMSKNKGFTGRARFGNASTKVGTKFRVLVLLLQKASDIEKFKVGTSHREFPDGAPRSVALEVVLGNPETPVAKATDAPAAKPAEKKADELVKATTELSARLIHKPKDMDVVGRTCEVAGKLAAPGFPVILIRCDAPGNHWWVQEHPKLDEDGTFKMTARVGNDKTPEGSAFQLLALILSSSKDAGQYEPGAHFKDLPEGVQHSAMTRIIMKTKQVSKAAAATPSLSSDGE